MVDDRTEAPILEDDPQSGLPREAHVDAVETDVEFALVLTGSGRVYHLRSGENLIGRAPNCNVLLDTASISRIHARIVIDDSIATIEDLGSRNGTFIDQQRIDSVTRLSHSVNIRFGSIRVIFKGKAPGGDVS